MSTNSVKNTDFLNNKSIEIKDGDYVFIKPINIRNNLHYIQYNDFNKNIDNYTHVDPNNVENQENKIIFEIFTLDEGKYNEKCKSDTQNPFSIDEVAKYKGLYSIEKGKNPDITGTHKQINTNQSNVYVTFDNGIVSKVSDVIKYTPTQIHNTLTNDHRQINQQNNQQNKQPFTEDFTTDLALNYYLHHVKGYNDEQATLILRNFSTLDNDTQNKVKKKVITNEAMNDNHKKLMVEIKKQPLLKILSSADTNSIKDEISKVLNGGKATRRRKRKGKKRSKNTRKKRKSKKQRRQ